MSPRRQPDGRPEWRSVDEMLAQAIAGEDFATLPGKGQPLDLSAYFASGPEHRIAGKLLKDNEVLPQTLVVCSFEITQESVGSETTP